jgi:type II secretion system protein C
MKTERYKTYIRKVLFISKSVLILVLVYVIVRTLVPGNTERSSTPASAMGANTVSVNRATGSTNLSLEDYAEIIEGNPFDFSGQTAGSGKWASMTDQYSVSEDLGLALSGTISGNPEVARAIIKDIKTGVLDSYKINQIVGGARIESIEKNSVALVYGGQRMVLKLNIIDSSGNNSATPQTTNEMHKVVKADPSTTKADTNNQTKSGYMEAILNNAVIKPYYSDGQAEGLQITGLENISVAKDIGLKNKDVIRSVNGHLLTNKQKAFQVFKKATSQSAIDIELLRDNKTKKLSFPL